MNERPREKYESEATQQTAKFFETLLRASPDGIVVTDAMQNIVVVNEPFCALFGQRRQDMVETNLLVWLDQLDADAPQRWAELERRVRLEGACRDVEFRLATQDGVRRFSVNGSLLEQAADEETGVIISLWRDVTERVQMEQAPQETLDEMEMRVEERTADLAKVNEELHVEIAERVQAEEALRRLEAKYRTLFTNIADPVLIFDQETLLFLDCNQSALDRYGYTLEEWQAMTPLQLHPPEELETVERNIADEEDVSVHCYTHITKEGERLQVEIHTAALDYQDRKAWVSIIRDITERQYAEQEIRRQTAQLEALREVGLELTAQLDLNTLLHSIVSSAIELLGGTGGGIYLYRMDQDVLEWIVSIGPTVAPVGTILHRGEGLSGKVLETGEPIIVDDYWRWEGQSDAWEGYPFAAIVGMPVRWGEEFLGVLNVNADAPSAFSSADAELLSLFATQAAIAIRNARLYEQAQQQFPVPLHYCAFVSEWHLDDIQLV